MNFDALLDQNTIWCGKLSLLLGSTKASPELRSMNPAIDDLPLVAQHRQATQSVGTILLCL